MSMLLTQLNFHGDPNIGLYARATDTLCIIGSFVSDRSLKAVRDYLKVDVKKFSIANTDFIGLFSSANSNGILVSRVVTETEKKALEKVAGETGINFAVLDSKFSALGNLILCNDKGCIASRLFRRNDIEKIKDCLDVEVVSTKIAHTDIVGACGVATNKGCLLHRDSTETELVRDILKVDADIGTTNFGSAFVGSGVIANSNGALAGDRTTPPEIDRLVQTLDLM